MHASRVLAHKVVYIFEYVFWIFKDMGMKLDQLVMENVVRIYSARLGGLVPKFSLIYVANSINP